MVRLGAVGHIREHMKHRGQNNVAEALVAKLEKEPGHSEPRTTFVGKWILNLRPSSRGIYTIAPDGEDLLMTCDIPDAPLCNDKFALNDKTITMKKLQEGSDHVKGT